MPPQPSPLSQEDINAGEKWLTAMYQMADAKDISMIEKYCTEDVVVNFANSPPLQGRQSLEQMYDWEYGGCMSIDHGIEDIRVLHDQVMAAISVTYVFTSGVKKTTKCFVVWHKTPASDRATRGDIYGDFNEVFTELITIRGPPTSF